LSTLEQLQTGSITSKQLGKNNRLKISENLTDFPREILDLAPNLEVLDLSDNQLSSLPDDFGRLKALRVLFLSNNLFDHVPAVLADCINLEMVSFKANRIATIPENAFPKKLRWLILSHNQIEKLPDSIGQLDCLRKLALAGNRLTQLPESMAACSRLELVRLSANSLKSLPDWLLQLPKLAWLSFAGNEFCDGQKLIELSDEYRLVDIEMADIKLMEQLGEGASGVVYRAEWINQPESLEGTNQYIAVKLFKGVVTSDGYVADEMACCLYAGSHPSLIKTLGRVSEGGQLGLIMELIPENFINLGLPPTLDTCTRDTFKTGSTIEYYRLLRVLQNMAEMMTHLHDNGVCHGDVYAHNTMLDDSASVLFGDFGAASYSKVLPKHQQEALAKIEVRAFGCMIEDLLVIGVGEDLDFTLVEHLEALKVSCLQDVVSTRPEFRQIEKQLANLNK